MPSDDRDRELFDHLAEEFDEFGVSAVEFLVTATDFATSGNATRQPRLAEAIAYCIREALKRILDSAERPGAGRWQAASRRVTTAKQKLDQVRGLPGGEEDAALVELLRAVDELDDFHNEEGLHERRIIAVLVNRTGTVPLEAGRNLVDEYQRLIEELNTAVHEHHDLDAAREALDRALRLLRQLFLPPDLRLADLDALAATAEPTAEDAHSLQEAISAPSHLEYFFARAVSVRWLALLVDSGLVTPPAGQAAWPVYRLVERLASTAADEIVRWLDDAYVRWGGDPARARYLVRAAADLGTAGHKFLVRALSDYQQDSSICHTVDWAIRDIDPSSPIVLQIADYLLNPNGGLQRISALHRDEGALGKLVDGVTVANAGERLRLLSYKLRSVPVDDTGRRLTLAERGGSIADRRVPYGDDRFDLLLEALVAAISKAFEAGVSVGAVLEATNVLEGEVAGRLRSWILGTAPDGDLALAVKEVTAAITAREPCGDDLRLIERIATGLDQDAYVEEWRTALGQAPSAGAIASALSDHTVEEDWFRLRDWSAVLPDECVVDWKTAVTLLAGAYGPVTRESFERRRPVEAGMGRSPMTVEEIVALPPEEAAATIAAWRPDPSAWLVGARELARALEGAVERDPQPWLRSPIEIIGILREPIYISHYFRAISRLDADLSGQAAQIVEAVAFCRSHPWDPAVLGRDDFDYDPDWSRVDQDGVAALQKLADADSGFGNRTEQAWALVADAARNRSDESSVISPRDDPLATAINRASTKALEAAISLMAYEFRESESVRPDGLALLDEALHIPGWDGAEHRSIIAPRLGFLLHVARDWVEARVDLLFGADAPDQLGQLTVDLAVKWGRPNQWIFEQARVGILDAAGRRVENALTFLLIGMLWEVPGYEPRKLVERLAQIDPTLLSDAGESLGRLLRSGDIENQQLDIATDFWRAVLQRGRVEELAGFGWWSEVRMLEDDAWEALTLEAAEKADGHLDWSHAVAERAAEAPISAKGLAILNQLVRGQIDDWDRMSILDTSVQALKAAKGTLGATEEFRRLRTTLIERGRFDAKEL